MAMRAAIMTAATIMNRSMKRTGRRSVTSCTRIGMVTTIMIMTMTMTMTITTMTTTTVTITAIITMITTTLQICA